MRRKWPVLGASPSIVDGRPDEERPDGLFADLMKVGDAVTELRNGKWKRTSLMQGTRELVARALCHPSIGPTSSVGRAPSANTGVGSRALLSDTASLGGCICSRQRASLP